MRHHYLLPIFLAFGLIAFIAIAQDHHHHMPSSDQPAMHPGGMDDATEQMSHQHLDMGPHMKMSTLRAVRPGDQERAAAIVQQTRAAIEKYKDVHAAIADGYKEFLPKSPGTMRHFTNYSNAMAARNSFDPARPASLLYEKHGNDYRLIGVMFTAPKSATEEDLDQRVPLSVAQWHEHVNICWPPFSTSREEMRRQLMPPHAKFGLAGSIATEAECSAAGGHWMPQIFGWMLHMYPYEKDPEAVWSLERQHEQMEHMH